MLATVKQDFISVKGELTGRMLCMVTNQHDCIGELAVLIRINRN